jgi:hypothetical protein
LIASDPVAEPLSEVDRLSSFGHLMRPRHRTLGERLICR